MGFLSSFGNIVNEQFAIGENTSHSLDNKDGISYGVLGKFENSIDKAAERSYIEDGFIRDIRPRKRSIIFQQPDIYIVIKKRMFSSLVENSRLDLLEEKERLLISASKRLFQNKCRVISAYERLTKIEQMTIDDGKFNTFLGPSFLNLLDSGDIFNVFDLSSETKSAIETLRKVLSYSVPGELTNWTTNDWDAVFSDDIGEGPGTFELTNVASVKTTVSTEWAGGGAQLTIEDPYNLLTITEKDIDQALSDVTNPLRNGDFFKFTQIELQNRINELQESLSKERRDRFASNISFKISIGTIISKRVRAIIDEEGVDLKFQYSTGTQDAFKELESANDFFDVVSVSVDNFLSTGSVQLESQFIQGNEPINISQNNQLTHSEHVKFNEIIANIYTLLAQGATSKREANKAAAEVNYTRNRMRLFFNGKYMIQPMDVIAIYMTSRTGEDERLPGGFSKQQNETGLPIFQRFDSIIKNINNKISDLRDPYGSFSKTMSFDDIERQSKVGPNFPKWLWKQFKQDITSQPTGPCIFSGIVGKDQQGVTGSWSDGKWTISITCEDNTGYFNKSQINFKPAADVFNSSIYDPLTPFDISFDASTGVPITDITAGDLPPLLPENEDLLQSGILTFRSGPDKGSSVTRENYCKQSNEISFDEFRKVLHDPEGLVYRWKQGIQTLTKSGRPYPTTSVDQERTVLLTNEPFAGQDIMNVISLLVTGQPYNYDTFLKAAIANGNSLGSNDSLTNIPAATTYIQGLLADIERSNIIWGNFIPYKKLVVNPVVDGLIAQARLDIVTTNTKLKQKLNERARAQDELSLMQGGYNIDLQSAFSIDANGNTTARDPQNSFDVNGAATSIKTKIDSLDREIAQLQSDFNYTYNQNPDIGLTIVGSDINSSLTSTNDTASNSSQKQRSELELRRNLFKFTSRQFWQVRANEDSNLFIVDDQYDKNFDILAFERKIGSAIEVFNSQYSSISDQITTVKKILGFEVFANSQGHIEARPPTYNKVPSSVFYKMFRDRDAKGIKVFPDFLETLYFNQIKGLFNQIEIFEDEIRLRAVALGAKNDDDIINMISANNNEGFGFLTKFNGGGIGSSGLQNILIQTNPDFTESLGSQALEELNTFETGISKLLKINRLFTINTQAEAAYDFNINVAPDRQADMIEPIRERLRNKTGREPKDINDLFGNDKFRRIGNQTASKVDRINLFSQIGNILSERQILLRSLSGALKNLREGVSVNAPNIENDTIFQGGAGNIFKASGSNKASRSVTTPFLSRDTEIPQFLEHMIEYENEDDIGLNSGRRFIITADRIVRLTISENPPPYTMVTVNGKFAEGFIEPVNSFKTSKDGNAITSAYSVDYDLWYQYGFRVSNAIEAPFLNDPDSQCAPFAVATLIEARENILQGSVEVTGYNEYYQPGDVVYIEDRNLLFYVRSVSHSFSYGNLSTTLDLSYGHSPGEYIPTMLDVVGKIMYNAKGFTGQFRNERFQMLGSSRSLGALALENMIYSSGSLNTLLQGRFGERNKKILTNILYAISGSLNQVNFRRQKSKIKIVYYKTLNSNYRNLNSIAVQISDWLIYPEQNTPDGLSTQMLSKDGRQKTFGLNTEDIIIEEVDLTDSKKQTRAKVYPRSQATDAISNTQGPSTAAIALAKLVGGSNIKNTQFKEILSNSVIDIFVEYEIVKNTTISTTSGNSEADQEANELINKARGGRATSVGV